MLTPYLMYLKIGAAVVLLLIIGGLYWWISNAFQERDELKLLSEKQATQITGYQEAMARDAQIREAINETVSKIKVTSNTIIQKIYSDPPPVAGEDDVIRLFVGGVPTETGMPTFSNATSVHRPTGTP